MDSLWLSTMFVRWGWFLWPFRAKLSSLLSPSCLCVAPLAPVQSEVFKMFDKVTVNITVDETHIQHRRYVTRLRRFQRLLALVATPSGPRLAYRCVPLTIACAAARATGLCCSSSRRHCLV